MRYQSPNDDPVLLRSKIEALEMRCIGLETDLGLARQHACRWEEEAKYLRKQLNAKRQDETTKRITRRKP